MIVATICDPQLANFEVPLFLEKVVSFLFEFFNNHASTPIVTSVLIWLAATFRRNNGATMFSAT